MTKSPSNSLISEENEMKQSDEYEFFNENAYNFTDNILVNETPIKSIKSKAKGKSSINKYNENTRDTRYKTPSKISKGKKSRTKESWRKTIKKSLNFCSLKSKKKRKKSVCWYFNFGKLFILILMLLIKL